VRAIDIAKALNGRKDGKQWRCACPIHGGDSLMVRDGKNGRPVLWCFGGCEAKDVLAALRKSGVYTNGHDAAPVRPEPEPETPITKVRSIFRRGRKLWHTLGENYLVLRGLDPTILDHNAVRFLPATENYQPALVALVTAFTDATEVRGLQFTPLTQDAKRDGERRFLTGTRAKGGVIRLTTDNGPVLGVAEGLETALAVMTAFKQEAGDDFPVWSTCGKGNMASLPVLPDIEDIHIFADPDGNEQAEQLATRWVTAGRRAFIVAKRDGDWNDG
jgi:putative DNA primase/helicase